MRALNGENRLANSAPCTQPIFSKHGEWIMRKQFQYTIGVMAITLSLFGAQGSFAQEPMTQSTRPILQLNTGGHASPIRGLSFIGKGKAILSVGQDNVARVWDLRDLRNVRSIRGYIGTKHDGQIYTVSLTSDESILAVAGWMTSNSRESRVGTIRLFDFRTGKLIDQLEGHINAVTALAFSHDGKTLASAAGDQIRLWDIRKRKAVWSISRHKNYTYHLAFTADGQRLISGSNDNTLALTRIADGKLVARMRGHQGNIISFAISPKDGTIATSSLDRTIRFWDGRTGGLLRTFIRLKDKGLGGIVFSPDGNLLLSGVVGNVKSFDCHVWNVQTGNLVVTYKGHNNVVPGVSISPNGKWAATAGGDNHEIHIWNLKTGEPNRIIKGKGRTVWTTAFSKDGRSLTWGYTKHKLGPKVSGPLEYGLTLPAQDRPLASPIPFGKTKSQRIMRQTATKGRLRLRRRQHGEEKNFSTLEIIYDHKVIGSIERDHGNGFEHLTYSFSPDGKTVFSGGQFGQLTAYDLTGRKIGDFAGHTGAVRTLAVSPNGELLLSGSADHTLKLWNIKTRENIVTVFVGNDGEWLIWTPEGYYATSVEGDSYIGWHINRGRDKEALYFSAAQLKNKFYRPDIVRQALLLQSTEKAIEQAVRTDFKLDDLAHRTPPQFRIVSPKNFSRNLKNYAAINIAIKDTSDAVRHFEIFVNSRKILTRGLKFSSATASNERIENFSIPLEAGINTVRIVAHNAIGKLTRKLVLFHPNKADGKKAKKGKLFLVSIGVDKYPNIGADLKFAGRDARAFHELLLAQAPDQYSEVNSLLLVSKKPTKHVEGSNVGGSTIFEPTSDNIEDALDLFRDAGPEDTVVLFLAGHGINDGEDYLFLSTDARRVNNVWRSSTVVRWQVLQRALQSARGRRLMLVDTCHSGNAFNPKLLKDANDAGIVVFSATDENTLAQEKVRLGHGVFTYALLEGLKGKADSSADKKIRLLELGNFISNEVKRLTNGLQEPIFYLSGVKNFTFALI